MKMVCYLRIHQIDANMCKYDKCKMHSIDHKNGGVILNYQGTFKVHNK